MAYSQELSSVKRMPRWNGDTGTISGLCDEVARSKIDGKLDVSAFQSYSSNAITEIYGTYPVVCTDNYDTTYEISMDTLPLVPGNGIEFVEQQDAHGYTSSVAIECTGGGGGGAIYNGISPIDVNNSTHQISAKGVSFGVQEPLFFVQDDNEAVIIGCSASGGGTTYTGDAQGALDEVYENSGVWLTAHQDISNLMTKSDSANLYPMTGNPSGFLTAHQSLTNYYTKNETSSKQEISDALSNAGRAYTGVAPIVVNNTTNEISADTWSLSAGEGLIFTDDNENKITKLEVSGEQLSAGPNVDIFSSGGYVIISAELLSGNDFGLNSNVHKDLNKDFYVSTSTSAWSNPTTGDHITTADSNNNKFDFEIGYCYDRDFIVVNADDYSFKNKNVNVYVSGNGQSFNSYSGSLTPTSNNLIIKLKDLVQTTDTTATVHCISALTVECDAQNGITSTGTTYKTYFEEDGHSPDDIVITDKYLNNTTSFYLDSVENLNIGSFNSFGYEASAWNGGGYIVGHRNSAYEGGAIFGGALNTAYHESFIGGGRGNTANCDGFCFGEGNFADTYSYSFGSYNSAYNLGFAFGASNSAENYGFCIGNSLKFNASGIAVGHFNKTSSNAALVIGNGASNSNRSDCFIIDYNGNVSAAGKISANGVELGAVPYNIVYTASLPATPDANTLYLIPEA